MSLIRKLIVGDVTAMTCLSNGLHLAIVDNTHHIKILDSCSGEVLRTLEGHKNEIFSLTLLSNGHLASGSLDKTIKIWDANAGTLVKTLEADFVVKLLLLLSNGYLVSSGYMLSTGFIKIWDTSNVELIKTLEFDDCNVYTMASLANGHLAVWCEDKTIKIWDTTNWTIITTLKCDCVSFSLTLLSNGHLASGSDGIIQIWDTSTDTLVRTLYGHRDRVKSLFLLPNGQLASGSEDGTVKIWDPSSGVLIMSLEDNDESSIFSMVLLANGNLASGHLYKTIKIWKLELESCTFGELVFRLECHFCKENIYETRKKIVATHCGYLLCKACFESWADNTTETLCTFCKEAIENKKHHASVVFL